MIRKHADSIGHAMNGLLWALRTQHNYRIHLFLIALSVLAGFVFQIRYNEWLIILALAMMGLIIETINTAIEKVGDAIDLNYNEHIKIAKDVSAAAMLIYSCGAAVGASMIFIPKIVNLIAELLK